MKRIEKEEKYFVADFETSDNRTKENEELQAWVWLWCVMECNSKEYKTGRSIEDFFDYIFSIADENTILHVNFHNLQFDGSFILSWLLENGYQEKETLRSTNKFRTLIDADGKFFYIAVMKNKCKICFEDSLKKIPMKVEEIAESLKIKEKGVIDYSRIIYPEDEISQEDVDYCVNDCRIVADALQEMFLKNGLTKLTLSSNAFTYFKESHKCDFRTRFPVLSDEEDSFVRASYKGGICQCREEGERYKGDIFCLDVNSMYPSVMRSEWLPCGKGEYFEGQYIEDKCAPLYVQRIVVSMVLKENHFPSVAYKNFYCSRQTFVEKCVDEEMTLTNIDIETMFENYDIIDIDYIDGYKYQSCKGVFDTYVDHFYNMKSQAKQEGNYFNYLLAKLMQNSLYGKFGMRREFGKQRINVNEEGILQKESLKLTENEGIYIPMASFITSYARRKLLKNAMMLGGKKAVLYMDTDSLHTINPNYENIVDVDSYRLGAWKLEGIADEGVFVRQKTYAEHINGEWEVKCSGMSKKAKKNISIESFEKGQEFEGNLKQVRVKGGAILESHTFSIR